VLEAQNIARKSYMTLEENMKITSLYNAIGFSRWTIYCKNMPDSKDGIQQIIEKYLGREDDSTHDDMMR
jgi:hypothetical protein